MEMETSCDAYISSEVLNLFATQCHIYLNTRKSSKNSWLKNGTKV
jgi:hypothetical protein